MPRETQLPMVTRHQKGIRVLLQGAGGVGAGPCRGAAASEADSKMHRSIHPTPLPASSPFSAEEFEGPAALPRLAPT